MGMKDEEKIYEMEQKFKRYESVILAMTPEERALPDLVTQTVTLHHVRDSLNPLRSVGWEERAGHGCREEKKRSGQENRILHRFHRLVCVGVQLHAADDAQTAQRRGFRCRSESTPGECGVGSPQEDQEDEAHSRRRHGLRLQVIDAWVAVHDTDRATTSINKRLDLWDIPDLRKDSFNM